MKRKDITALHDLTPAELQKKLQDLLSQMSKMKLEKKVGKLTNTKAVINLRRDVARIKTVISEKGTK